MVNPVGSLALAGLAWGLLSLRAQRDSPGTHGEEGAELFLVPYQVERGFWRISGYRHTPGNSGSAWPALFLPLPSAPASPLRGAPRDSLRFAEGKVDQPPTGWRKKFLYRLVNTRQGGFSNPERMEAIRAFTNFGKSPRHCVERYYQVATHPAERPGVRFSVALLPPTPFFLFLAVAIPVYRRRNPDLENRWSTTFAIAVLLYYGILVLGYLLYPSFLDHAEPTVACNALLLGHGKPIYTGLQTPDRITIMYGPVTFLLPAILELLLPNPVLAGKIAGALWSVTGLVLLGLAFYRNLSPRTALSAVCGCLLLVLPFENQSFWLRPDSLLLFSGCLAGAALVGQLTWGAGAALLGLAFGLAVGGKIHGFLYLVPFLPIAWRRWRLRGALMIAAVAAGVCLLPFLVGPSFPLGAYVRCLLRTTRQQFARHNLLLNLRYSSLFLLPLLGSMISGLDFARGIRGLVRNPFLQAYVLLAVCALIVSVLASKVGAGPHHLLAFAPAAAFLWGQFHHRHCETGAETAARPRWPRAMLHSAFSSAGAAAALYAGCLSQYSWWHDYFRTYAGAAAATRSVRQVLASTSLRRITMGYTDQRHYRSTFVRPWLVERSGESFLDPPVLMDLYEAGQRLPDVTLEAIRRRRYAIFVLPAQGLPFSMKSFYASRRPIFGQEFRETFLRSYQPSRRVGVFTLWTPRTATTQ